MPRQPLIFLSPRVPHPLNSGAKIRTHALLSALTKAYDVRYCGFLQPDLSETEARQRLGGCASVDLWPEPSTTLPGKGWLAVRAIPATRPATMLKYDSPAMAERVARLAAEHPGAIVHADHLHMACYLAACRSAALRAIDEHNVEAQIVERAAETFRPAGALAKLASPAVRPWLAAQAAKMRRYEAQEIAQADLTLAVSGEDAAQLAAMAPGSDVRVIPNGVDDAYFAPAPDGPPPIPGRLVFTGSMNWLPNQDAVRWFCQDILPVLNARHPRQGGWSLDIVGQSPSASVRELAGPNVRVTGMVDDVRPYLRQAQALAVPLRIGGGSRLKILEGFSIATPVVSTTVGCEGLGVADGRELLIGDDPASFAAAVARIANEPGLGGELAARARRRALEGFTWTAIAGKMLAIYSEKLASQGACSFSPIAAAPALG